MKTETIQVPHFYKLKEDETFRIAREKKLKCNQLAMLINIATLADNDIGACFASNEALGARMGLTGNRVSKIISSLFKLDVLSITMFPHPKKIKIGGKEYKAYRLISIKTPNHTENKKAKKKTTYQNQVSGYNHTQNKKAKNKGLATSPTNYTKNNIYINSTSQCSYYIEKKHTEEDRIFTTLFKFELAHLKNNSKIIYKARYATVVVKNWIREGITTVEEAKKVINEYKPPQKQRIINEKLPQWYYDQQQLKNTQQQDDDDLTQVQDDIKHLLDKINRETAQNSNLSDVKRE